MEIRLEVCGYHPKHGTFSSTTKRGWDLLTNNIQKPHSFSLQISFHEFSKLEIKVALPCRFVGGQKNTFSPYMWPI
jgi:hypothetical protein